MGFPWGRGNPSKKDHGNPSRWWVGRGGGGGVKQPGIENLGGGINLGKKKPLSGVRVFSGTTH